MPHARSQVIFLTTFCEVASQIATRLICWARPTKTGSTGPTLIHDVLLLRCRNIDSRKNMHIHAYLQLLSKPTHPAPPPPPQRTPPPTPPAAGSRPSSAAAGAWPAAPPRPPGAAPAEPPAAGPPHQGAWRSPGGWVEGTSGPVGNDWLSGWPPKKSKLVLYHENGPPKRFKVHELRK